MLTTSDGMERSPLGYTYWRIFEVLFDKLHFAVMPAPYAIARLLAEYGWKDVPRAWLQGDLVFEEFWIWAKEWRNPLLDLIATPAEIEAHEQRRRLPRTKKPRIRFNHFSVWQNVLELKVQGLGYREIAKRLEVSESTVYKLRCEFAPALI